MVGTGYESALKERGVTIIAGADEVGRGAWAGPVVAGAVVLPEDLEGFVKRQMEMKIKLDDSKKLTALQRDYSASWLKTEVLAWGVGVSSHTVVNRKGVMAAVEQAYRRAIRQVSDVLGDRKIQHLLVDGYKIPRINGVSRSLQTDIVGGDGISLSIAAASILAKTYRDELMRRLAVRYGKYGWQKNKGYGTREHREAIFEHGMCRLHRVAYVETGMRDRIGIKKPLGGGTVQG